MNKKIIGLRYGFERIYPHIFSLITTALIYLVFNQRKIYSFTNLNEAISSVLTITGLIIGFLGAVLPVILSMKNGSKIVRYIFEKDQNSLFLKYIRSNVLSGLITVGVSIFMFFVNELNCNITKNLVTYFWIFMLCEFFFITYRCLDKMIKIVFIKDTTTIDSKTDKLNNHDDLRDHYKGNHKNQ